LDISNIGSALEVAKPDIVFHLAAQSFIPSSFENPLAILMTNSLIAKGKTHAVKFSWDQAAEKTLEVYKEVEGSFS
ncbi:unnamed protein product, partial [marine sediment metagenome]